MANKDWPSGLQPVIQLNGDAPVTTRFPLLQAVSSSKYSTLIYKGALVLWHNTNNALKANAVTNSATVVGVAAEAYLGSAASTQTDLAVWEASKHIFAIQSDNTTTTSSINTLRMKNAPVINQTLGNATNGLSKMELDFSGATSADNILKIIGHTGEIGESGTGANIKCLVRINFGHGYEQNATAP